MSKVHMIDVNNKNVWAKCIQDKQGKLKKGKLIESIQEEEESGDNEAVNSPATRYKIPLEYYQYDPDPTQSSSGFSKFFRNTKSKPLEKKPLGQFMTVIDISGADVTHPERDTSKMLPEQFVDDITTVGTRIEIKEVEKVSESGQTVQHVKRCTLYTG